MALSFRPLLPSDTDAAHAIVSDWEVTRHLGSWPWPAEQAVTEARISALPPEGTEAGAVLFDGVFVGGWNLFDGRYGVYLAQSHWRRGIGISAAAYAIDRHFAKGHAEIKSDVWETNPRSQHLQARLGFSEIGRAPKPSVAMGREVMNISYALARGDWEKLRPTLPLAISATRS